MLIVEYLEKSFRVEETRRWADDVKHLSIAISLVYILLVFAGQRLMKHRKAFDLRVPLFLWNSALALFSLVGVVKIGADWNNAVARGLRHSVCDSSVYTNYDTSIWTYLFGLSKIYELGDTAFLVLRKRPVIFLHWYHHATVFIYAAYSYAEQASSGRWYMAMNLFVHSVMYSYYALASLRLFRFPKFLSASVTGLQILQMVVGLVVSTATLFLLLNEVSCKQSWKNALAGWMIYFSYLLLFLRFFYDSYLKKTN